MKDKKMTIPDIRIDETGYAGTKPLLEIRDLAITFKTAAAKSRQCATPT